MLNVVVLSTVFFIVLLTVIMRNGVVLSGIMLIPITLNVVMQSVVMLGVINSSVAVPKNMLLLAIVTRKYLLNVRYGDIYLIVSNRA
jgi:hypothetical protein